MKTLFVLFVLLLLFILIIWMKICEGGELPPQPEESGQPKVNKLDQSLMPTDAWREDVLREARKTPESERRQYLERAAYAHLMGEWMDKDDPEIYELVNGRQPSGDLPVVCNPAKPRPRMVHGWPPSSTKSHQTTRRR